MTALRLALFAFGAALLSGVDTRLPGPGLTFEQRVEAQRAIERIHYSHLIGATQPFDEAVADEVLRRKVTTYLKQTAALEEFWHTPVTAEMLRSETERMTRSSRMPDRLAELRRALGDDPLLIQECLARPALVDRLARGRFSSDPIIHADARRAAETLRERLVEHDASLSADYPRPEIRELKPVRARKGRSLALSPEDEQADGRRVALEQADFDRELLLAPAIAGEPGAVSDEGESLVIRVMNKDDAGKKSIAVYAFPKTTWEEWWSGVEPTLDETTVETVADPGADLTFETAGTAPAQPAASCAGEMRWSDALVGGILTGRSLHTAVWTSSRMIVWGGTGAGSSGGQYDPATDAWIGMTSVGAPSPRILHTAVWTGSLMLVWGGGTATIGAADAGARYDPVSDSWTPISSVGAPIPRTLHSAVWTGSRMIVWGGFINAEPQASGGRYDPATDTWAPVSPLGAPTYRDGQVAVWTGSVMVLWGGSGGGTTGGRYDPATDTWQATSVVNAPSPRFFVGSPGTELEFAL